MGSEYFHGSWESTHCAKAAKLDSGSPLASSADLRAYCPIPPDKTSLDA